MGIRDIALLASRTVVGGYLAAHGAQKLFGTFGGHGLEPTAAGFERLEAAVAADPDALVPSYQQPLLTLTRP